MRYEWFAMIGLVCALGAQASPVPAESVAEEADMIAGPGLGRAAAEAELARLREQIALETARLALLRKDPGTFATDAQTATDAAPPAVALLRDERAALGRRLAAERVAGAQSAARLEAEIAELRGRRDRDLVHQAALAGRLKLHAEAEAKHRAEIARLAQAEDAARQARQVAAAELQRMEAALVTLRREHDGLDTEVAAQAARLETLSAALDTGERMRSELQSELASLAPAVERARRDLATTGRQAALVASGRDRVVQEVDRQAATLRRLQQEIETANARRSTLDAEIALLGDRLGEAERTVADGAARRRAAEAELATLTARMQADIRAARVERAALGDDTQAVAMRLRALEAEAGRAVSRLERLAAGAAQAEAEAEEARAARDRATLKRDEAETALAVIRKRMQEEVAETLRRNAVVTAQLMANADRLVALRAAVAAQSAAAAAPAPSADPAAPDLSPAAPAAAPASRAAAPVPEPESVPDRIDAALDAAPGLAAAGSEARAGLAARLRAGVCPADALREALGAVNRQTLVSLIRDLGPCEGGAAQ